MINKSNTINILFLSHIYPNRINPTYGIFIHNQVKQLLEMGCLVRVVAPVPYAPKFLRFKNKWKSYGEIPLFDLIDNVPVYYPRYLNLPGTWFHGFSGYSIYASIKSKVTDIINEFTPHILHTHTATPDGYVGLLLKRIYNLPLVCSLRGSDINVYPHFDKLTMFCTKKVISEVNQLVSVSKSLKMAAEEIINPLQKIKVIYNGCNLHEFAFNLHYRQLYREKINISKKGKIIICVAQLKKSKGIFELITAFSILVRSYSDLHLLFVGDGPEYSNIRKKVTSNNLIEKVHFTGNIPHNEIPRWLSASDIFALPTHYEGLPNAVLEALACGLPVVATKVGGIPEIIDNRKTGILIDGINVNSLTDAIKYLLSHEEIAKRIGNAGRKKVEQKFSWKNNAQEMIKIYNSLVDANS